MRWTPFLLALLAACGDGPRRASSGSGDPVDPAAVTVNQPGSGGPLALKSVVYWAYQIQDHYLNPQPLADSHYDLLIIDQARSINDLTGYNDALLVSKLQSSSNHVGGKKLVLCYVDIGQAENFRWYWQQGWKVGDPTWIAGKDPDGWAGDFVVKFWAPEWKAILKSYLDRIIADGYDGIYMDWLEAFEFGAVAKAAAAEGKNGRAEMAALVKELAAYARAKKPGFLFVGQNGAVLADEPDYLSTVDGQAQEDTWFSGGATGAGGDIATKPADTQDLIKALNVFKKAGIPVFTCDYAFKADHVSACYTNAATLGFVGYVTGVQLDRLTSTPPPGY